VSAATQNSFLSTLVQELREQLKEVSRVAAQRAATIKVLQHQISQLQSVMSSKQDHESALSDQLNGVSTQRSALQRQLLLANAQYLRAECKRCTSCCCCVGCFLCMTHALSVAGIAASFEKQLQAALSYISKLPPSHDYPPYSMVSGSNSTSIDYSFFPDLEPSAVLRAAIQSADLSRQLGVSGGGEVVGGGGKGKGNAAPPAEMPDGALGFGTGLNYNDSALGGEFVEDETDARMIQHLLSPTTSGPQRPPQPWNATSSSASSSSSKPTNTNAASTAGQPPPAAAASISPLSVQRIPHPPSAGNRPSNLSTNAAADAYEDLSQSLMNS
jgi:hypothetical protein